MDVFAKSIQEIQTLQQMLLEKTYKSIKIKDLKSFVDYLIQRIIKHRQSKRGRFAFFLEHPSIMSDKPIF
jgi:hypothetical protein